MQSHQHIQVQSVNAHNMSQYKQEKNVKCESATHMKYQSNRWQLRKTKKRMEKHKNCSHFRNEKEAAEGAFRP